jgi:hypothetical protein
MRLIDVIKRIFDARRDFGKRAQAKSRIPYHFSLSAPYGGGPDSEPSELIVRTIGWLTAAPDGGRRIN